MSNEGERMDDMIKILVATDIHLGYEHNHRRGGELNDSFTTFEEILTYAKDYEVDFILLGGDLFHDTKPSQPVVLKCMDLLRKYCLGTRENNIQFLSDPDVVFRHCAYKTVNFEDPNFNISIPVFSIHGNHDDPNFGAVGSMDVLSVSGLVNYFGKWTDLTKVTVAPIILKKGETHVALYGLSYINDQRLSRLIRDDKVEMLRPEEISESFNIFVLHQNRVRREDNAFIPEHKLPSFLNLVIWGHEHECRITPEFIPGTEYFITQPGSSVATSLCEGEAKEKYVGLLSVYKNKFKMKKLKLKTVRPFVFDNLILSEQNIVPQERSELMFQAVCNFVDNHIENVLIPRAARQLTGHPKQPIQPFVRLRIFYSRDDEQFDTNKLCQKYVNEVANPTDIVLFRKEKHAKDGSKLSINDMDFTDMEYVFSEDIDWSKSVQQELKKYFEADENKDALSVLTINGLNEALTRYVTREDGDAFKDVLTYQMKKTMQDLETRDVDNEEAIAEELKKIREERCEKENEEQEELRALFKTTTRRPRKPQDDIISLSQSDEDEEQRDGISTGRGKTASRGTRSRGRGSRGGRGRAKTKDTIVLDVTKASAPRTTMSRAKKQGQNIMQCLAASSQRAPSIQFISDSE